VPAHDRLAALAVTPLVARLRRRVSVGVSLRASRVNVKSCGMSIEWAEPSKLRTDVIVV